MDISLVDVSRHFRGPDGDLQALAPVSFSVADNEFLGIVGPSGCGKTTLLKVLAGILEPTSGEVRRRAPSGRTVRTALAFQDHGLFPWMTVLDNIAFGLEAHGVGRAERYARARSLVDRFGLSSFVRHYPYQLSGGMKQRAGLARAFLIQPDVLLLDEPFASVDAQTRLRLQDDLLSLWSETKASVVYVTHDIEEAILLSDRILVLSARPGRIKAEVPVPIARPRSLVGRDEPDIKELKWRIWNLIDSGA